MLRLPPREEDARQRIVDFRPVDRGYTRGMAHDEASRCLHCPKPSCIEACPVSVDIPAFIAAIAAGEEENALDIIKKTNLFPSICGRVCPQERQCEGACVLGKGKDPTGAVSVGELERYVGDLAPGFERIETPPRASGRRVAIVGSGPSGLSCAAELARKGHDVTVLESFHVTGGVLAYGIPNFRLPKEVLRREVNDLTCLGVRLKTNRIIGRTGTVEELLTKDGYDAVFIGVGAGVPKFVGMPGENLAGVLSANEFLTRTNLVYNTAKPEFTQHTPVLPVGQGNRVCVIGGGNVAMDAARTAVRLGAKSVTLVYRRAMEQLPARAVEVEHAIEEGVIFELLSQPTEVLDDGRGCARALTVQRMHLVDADGSGRLSPEPTPGAFATIPCDTVIVAIGTRANPLLKLALPDAERTPRDYLVCDETGMTSVPGVFAGGDIVTGAATVISAMGAGRHAAKHIDRWVRRKQA